MKRSLSQAVAVVAASASKGIPAPHDAGPGYSKSTRWHEGLSEELVAAVVSMVRGGASPANAAIACGIPAQTWYGWERAYRDGGGEPAVRALLDEVVRALADSAVGAESLLKVDDVRRWLAGPPLRALKRLAGGESEDFDWREEKRVESKSHVTTVQVGAPAGYDYSRLSDAELDDVVRLLKKAEQLALPPATEAALDVTPEDADDSAEPEQDAPADPPVG